MFIALAASLDRFKGHGKEKSGTGRASRWLAAATPLTAVFDDPIGQCPFEADIVAGFLRLDPFVFHYLLLLRLKFAVKRRLADQVLTVGALC